MNVLVTGGGTVAPIDDVRQIRNLSTGRLSAAISESALARGAEVWHLHAPGALLPYARDAVFDLDVDREVETLRLLELVKLYRMHRRLLHREALAEGTVAEYQARLHALLGVHPIDVVFLAMAVSDYEPEPHAGKIDSGAETLTIVCRRTPKVIRTVRDRAPDAYLVGFKLTSGASRAEMLAEAERACEVNRVDVTVANDQSAIRQGRHALVLVRPGEPPVDLEPGDDLADRLVEHVLRWARESIMRREPIPLDPDDPNPEWAD
jgi:phosphopantothenate-cysteine ligase